MKQEFEKAEVEVIRFEENDIITESTDDAGVGGGTDDQGD